MLGGAGLHEPARVTLLGNLPALNAGPDHDCGIQLDAGLYDADL